MLFVLLDLHLQPDPSQERVLALLRALAQTEPFIPLLICRKHSPLADRAAAEKLPVLALGSSWPLHPVSLLRIWRRLHRHRQVIVHSFDEQAAVLAHLLAAQRKSDRTIVMHTRFFTPGKHLPMLQKSYAAAGAFVCGSSAVAKLVQQENGLSPDIFRIIPPGTQQSDYPERVEQRNGRIAICMPGALTEGQGQESLVQAMAALWQMEDLPPWEVRLVGSGPMFHFLLEEAQKLGVLPRLAILGDQDLRAVLPQCKLLVLPPGELVYAPALAGGWAVGLPVICPALPAALDLVREGENALLVAPHNPQDLAAAILRIIRDATLAEKLVHGGKKTLVSVSEERMIADYVILCHELIARQGWATEESPPAVCNGNAEQQ